LAFAPPPEGLPAHLRRHADARARRQRRDLRRRERDAPAADAVRRPRRARPPVQPASGDHGRVAAEPAAADGGPAPPRARPHAGPHRGLLPFRAGGPAGWRAHGRAGRRSHLRPAAHDGGADTAGTDLPRGGRQPGRAVAVVTARYWREALGAGDVLGSPLVIDGQAHTVVGVLAPAF